MNQDSFNEITCPKRFLASKCDVGNWKIHIRDIFKILVKSIKGNSLTQKLQKVDVKMVSNFCHQLSNFLVKLAEIIFKLERN